MQDLILDEFDDLVVENGDFANDLSDEQHQELLLKCRKGDFKENPDTCVGVATWLNDDDPDGLLGEIKKEFEKDGMVVKLVDLQDGKLNIDARYE